jgi:fructose-1,6-bisphosphatase/inositol monophosphatase family enzyme
MAMDNKYPDPIFLRAIAEDAGEIMLRHFNLKRDWTLKDDSTPLTVADTLINTMVLARFLERFPHINVLAEEGNREVDDAEYTVLCDPIDGTSCFALGIPTSAFCLSVLKDDDPIAGVIHDPFQRRTWIAHKGQGAFLNGDRIHVSDHREIKSSNIMLVKWHDCGFYLQETEAELMQRGAKVQNGTSLAYWGGLIASGTVEASIFPGTGGLETAAMQIVIEEAGGRVTDLFGKPIFYRSSGYKLHRGALASNGLIHEDLVALFDPPYVEE